MTVYKPDEQDPFIQRPRPADLEPREGKQHMGNRRTGKSRGGRGRGQLPWRRDPLIRERMDLIWSLWAQGYTENQMILKANELMVARGVPPIGIKAIRMDKKRILELVDAEDTDKRAEHLEALKLVKRRTWETFDGARSDASKATLLGVARSTEETMAKIDGSLAPIKTEQTVNISSYVDVLVRVASRHFGEERATEFFLEAKKELEGLE